MADNAVPRDTSGGRGTNTLQGEALEHDLGSGSSLQQVIVNNLSGSNGGGGGGGGGTEYVPNLPVYLQCQSNSADENMRIKNFFDIAYFDEAMLVIDQSNSNGANYYAEFWNNDTASWENLCSPDLSLFTAGVATLAYTTAWGSVKTSARIDGGTHLRVRQTGGNGSTDNTLACILFRGPAVVGEAGEPGTSSEIELRDDNTPATTNLSMLDLGVNLSVYSIAGNDVVIEAWEPVANGDYEDLAILFEYGDVLMHPPIH